MGLRALSLFSCTFLVSLSLFAQHADRSEGEKKNPAIGNPDAIAAGKKLYGTSCVGCHGPSGEGGRGPNLRERGAWHPLTDDSLFQTIHKGVPGADMPPTNLPEDQIWQLVAFVRSLTAPAYETPLPGNPEAGEKIFWGNAGCSNCHRIRGKGGMLGPDLSNAGATRAAEQLRQSILDPSADGAPTYRAATVTLRDGKVLKGVARNRTNYSVQLQDAKGNLHLLTADQIERIELGFSPMPADYAKRLQREEVTDVVAYLARQNVRAETEQK